MNSEKQKLLIEYLLSSSDTFALCQSIVQSDYFDPEYRNAVSFIQQYYDQYHTTPSTEQVHAETHVDLNYKTISPDEVQYTADEIEKFCRRKAIEQAVMRSPDLIKKGDYATVEKDVREAIMISLNRDLGLRYFESVDERLERMLNTNSTEPTGWSEVDQLLYGGLSRKELLLVSANSGGGKSITLANLAYNYIARGLNVLYLSLELSEDVIGQRFDTMFTGISRREWSQHVSEISTRVKNTGQKCGTLDIKQLPAGSCANDFRAYLKEYHLHYNMMPDLLIVDYLDEMGPNVRMRTEDVWTKDKYCTSELRQLAVDYNMFAATASQLNRDAVKASQHDHSHIAGGISKINVVDVYWSIMMTPEMMASGEVAFHFQKTRNSVGAGNTVWLKWDPKHLRITNRQSDDHISFKSRQQVDQQISKEKSLLDDQEDSDPSSDGLESLLQTYNS